MTDLERMGRRLAQAQDRQLEGSIGAATKQRLLAAPSRPAWRARSAVAAAAILAFVAAVVSWPKRDDVVSFAVGAEGRPGETGQWIAAPAGAPLPMRFSDGTVLTLAPSSVARVSVMHRMGADVVLERGEVDVTVVHRQGSRWRLDVGPFSVFVTGTRFALKWRPETESLWLRLDEGSVRIAGPLLGEGRTVSVGETVELSPTELHVEREATEADAGVQDMDGAAPEPAELVEPPEAPAQAVQPLGPHPAPSVPVPAPPSTSWRELSASGKYKEALLRAEADGFDEMCESTSAAELVALADTARFAGDVGRATQAYVAVRRRHPASHQAATATFTLGRLAFDRQGAVQSAAQWFRTYLAEQPSGPYAREAAGRLIEALERGGDSVGARNAAARYLERWPKGPHADKARSLVSMP